MDHRLRGPVLKLNRAGGSIEQLDSKIRAFSETHRYQISYEVEEERQETVVRARFKNELPEEFDVLAGEILFSLRSALDQLVCAIAAKEGQVELKEFYFPFANSKEVFESKDTTKKVAKLSETARNMLLGYAAYPEGNKFLWAINQLNLIDKHRQLIAVGAVVGNVTITGGVFNSGVILGDNPGWAPFAEGLELLRYGGTVKLQAEPNIKVNANVSFADIDFLQSIPMANALHTMWKIVKEIVEDCDKKLFRS
ncbi:hypothetical protein [Massilia sp. BHUDP2]|uniref:hypothetical protein n=1 Tax=Massilia sp. BHUDP2 TaxID=3034505 RepID=UPI0039066B6B